MRRFIRSAFVIGRRDFTATVLSKTFIFFLLAPLFPLLFGGVFGSIGASVASQAERPVVAVVSSKNDFDRLSAARGLIGLVLQVHFARHRHSVLLDSPAQFALPSHSFWRLAARRCPNLPADE